MRLWTGPALALTGLVAGHAPAAAQKVTFAELDGMSIVTSETQLRSVRSERGSGSVRVQIARRIAIGPGEAIQYSTSVTTVRQQKGDSDTRTWSAKTSLGRPHAWRDGQRVWVFENSALTALRTLDQGGTLVKVTLGRDSSGITCKVSSDFAREDGAGALKSTSTLHGVARIEILSMKQVADECRVTKR